MNGFTTKPFEEDADIIVDSGTDVYMCWYDRTKRDKDNADIQAQAIWRICKIGKIEANGTTIYSRMFPNGLRNFDFVMADYNILVYSFPL